MPTPGLIPPIEQYGFDPLLRRLGGNPLPLQYGNGALVGGEGSGFPLLGLFTLGDANDTPGQLELVVAPAKGDTFIRAGKTDFTNTEAGFILGIDDSDADKVKFYLGNATDYLNWNGATLVISGNLAAGSIDIGSGNTSFHVASNGAHWSGHTSYASAPFRVENNGSAVLANATVTGTINATAGTFSGNIVVTGTVTGGAFIGATLTTGSSGSNINLTATAIQFRYGTTVLGSISTNATQMVFSAGAELWAPALAMTLLGLTTVQSIVAGTSVIASNFTPNGDGGAGVGTTSWGVKGIYFQTRTSSPGDADGVLWFSSGSPSELVIRKGSTNYIVDTFVSDARLKTIQGPSDGMALVRQLRPIRYKDKRISKSPIFNGLTAQDLLEVLPEDSGVVKCLPQTFDEDTEDGYAVDIKQLIPVVIRAQQELDERLLALESLRTPTP